MEIFHSFNQQKNLALALGFFDGVHIGHKKVILNAVDFAKKHNTKSAIITFNISPACYLKNIEPAYITTINQKLEFFENMGVDYVYILDFNEKLSQISAKEFLELVIKYFSPSSITTGFNFEFGASKLGNSDFLEKYSHIYNYKYFAIDEVKYNEITVSSTNIRKLLQASDLETANFCLGHDFYIEASVIKGQQLARTLNSPTANFSYPDNIVKVEKGVYAVDVEYNDNLYHGIMNFGERPTVSSDNKYLGEVHIFDFNEDIYNKKIKIFPKKFIRKENKFENIELLKKQIAEDIEVAKNYFLNMQ